MLLIWRLVVIGVAVAPVSGPLVAADADDEKPIVVATTSIWADIVDRIDCGDQFIVETLIPVGGDVHSFEPSVRDRQRLGDAALVVANGGGLEASLEDTLDAVAGDGVTVLSLFDNIDAGEDPHLWFDPTVVTDAAAVISDQLVAVGADADTSEECLDEFSAELDELDAEVADILAVVPPDRRLLVTNHDALGRFADRYDLEILGAVIPGSSTLAEASPAELEQLADDIETHGVPAIFAEALDSTDEATTLADRLGVDVVTLYTDSLGEDGSGAETYPDLMRYNATAIADALGEERPMGVYGTIRSPTHPSVG
jgi:zinc/manganese transport system substrate-binding protein